MTVAATNIVAQQVNKPKVATAPEQGSATLAALPAAYPAATPVNYVRTWQPLKPFASETEVVGNSLVKEVNRVTQYVDGLGRHIQTVSWKAAPGELDLVTPVVYDELGREKYKYMPYASGSDGNFKPDPFPASIYSGTGVLQQLYPGEKYFYTQVNYEASPLSRVEKTMSPGNNWVGSSRGIQTQYLVNTTDDSVRLWSICFNALPDDADANPVFNIPQSAGVYAVGELSKTVTTDENNHQVIEYKDKEGHIVLKKVQEKETPSSSAYNDWLCTYYVYDDMGQLRFVMSPKAVQQVRGNNWSFNNKQTVADELCFHYEYDKRQRIIAKKIPGAGWVYMVYDQRDRLVYTQDAGLRAGKKWWMATFYDALNRPAQTAMLTGYQGTRATLQTFVEGIADGVTTVPGTGSYTSSTQANLQVNSWTVGVDYEATNSVLFLPEFVSGDAAEFTAEIVTDTIKTFGSSQELSAYAVPANGTFIPLTYSFYDDYSWTPAHAYTAVDNSKLGIGANVYGELLPAINSVATKGIATGSRVRVIENAADLTQGSWLETAHYYDDKGRMVQVNSDNYKGGQEVVTSRFDFAGKVISTYQVHTVSSADISTNRMYTEMDYDQAGRITQIRKTLNDDASTTQVIASSTYNNQGQLQQKVLGPETQEFSYNVRGWLKGINWATIHNNPWFAMDLSYDWGYDQNQYNGNIAGMRWYTRGSGKSRSYGYGYDAVNRLLYGCFTQQSGSDSWTNENGLDFSMQMGNGIASDSTYDANGNILSMKHMGWKGGGSTVIDNLKYTYLNSGNSNKLQNVVDRANEEGTKLGDFRTSKNSPNKSLKANATSYDAITDYYYDVNGNLVKDYNKDIGTSDSAGIEYNYLNLPYKIKVYAPEYANGVKGVITYIYDATGNKLEKRVAENADTAGKGNKTAITSYAGGFVYENNVLQYAAHEEGRIRPLRNPDDSTLTGYTFDWFLKDHLGNVRVVLTEEKKTDIYPAATLEGEANSDGLKLESTYYDIDTANIKPTPFALKSTYGTVPSNEYANNNGIPNPNKYINTDAISTKMYKLNGANGVKTGLGITLKVMAGDTVNVFGRSFWKDASWSNSNDGSSQLDPLVIFTGLLGGPAGVGGAHGVTASQVNGVNANVAGMRDLVSDQNSGTAAPKAFINYMFFDEQFRYVSGGYSQVQDTGGLKNHFNVAAMQNIPVDTSGYIYVYCSNGSAVDVYFDNLQVMLQHGSLVEETHYYPFGLTMKGISAKAAGILLNRYGITGKEKQDQEFSDGSGLEIYDFGARMLDQQTGRWSVIDSKSDKYVAWTPYNYVANNPVKMVDINGKEWLDANGNKIYENGAYTEYATGNDKRLGEQLRSTKTGAEQFEKLVNSTQKITVLLDKKSETQVDDEGNIVMGLTVPKFFKSSDGKSAEVATATLTLYANSVDATLKKVGEKGSEQIGNRKINKDITFIELLAIVFGHEIEHTTNKNVNASLQKGNAQAGEEEAYKISDALIDETKEAKKPAQ